MGADECKAATTIQKRWRGIKGRSRHARFKVTWHEEVAKSRRIKVMHFEKKRRSSAAVVLQASVKRGFARKRAIALQEIREHTRREEEKERIRIERIYRKAVDIEKIVRSFVAKCKFARLVYEKRSDEMEKEGLFETQKYIDGTRLYITGVIQRGLENVEDVVFRMEAKDVR